MGNGPSLSQLPDDFLYSRPRICLNYYPVFHRVLPTFWTSWDKLPILEVFPAVQDAGIPIILHPRHKTMFARHGLSDSGVHWWKVTDEQLGFGWDGKIGSVRYTSSIHWAAHIALLFLGFTTLLVVGFDCDRGSGTYEGMGIGPLPHFWDPGRPSQGYQPSWDRQFAILKNDWESRSGYKVVNITPGSKARFFEAEDWRKYYAPSGED